MADTSSMFTMNREQYSTKTLQIFRRISREVSGESCEISQGDVVIFGWFNNYNGKEVVSVASGCGQKTTTTSSDINQDGCFNWINFLFVKKEFQCRGFGREMMHKMEDILWSKSHVNIKIHSAWKTIQFFKHLGYYELGDPIDCVYSGSPLFKRLQTMEKIYTVKN